MTEPFLGEIQIFGFNFAPYGWALANGQTLPLTQNTALFSLVGITYGGDGRTTFQLPNLASRQACGSGTGTGLTQREIGDTFGEAAVALLDSESPRHSHALPAFIPDVSALSETPGPTNALGYLSNSSIYAAPAGSVTPNIQMIGATGGSQPHPNEQPFLGLTFCIALQGNFPQFN